MLDQTPTLPLRWIGHMYRRQLVSRRHTGHLQRVVAVCLSFDAFPLPRLIGRVGHRYRNAQRDAQVVHPAAAIAGLEYDQRRGSIRIERPAMYEQPAMYERPATHEQIMHRLWRGLHRLERVLMRERIVIAHNAVELPQIDGQDAIELDRMRLRNLGPMHGECSFRA